MQHLPYLGKLLIVLYRHNNDDNRGEEEREVEIKLICTVIALIHIQTSGSESRVGSC